MTNTDYLALPYRPNAGLMLLNGDNHIFVGRRIDTPDAWQMPQGGIDKGEEAKAAALRELSEETGVSADMVQVLAESPDWLKYDFPPEVAQKLFTGKSGKAKFRGQKQRWFLLRFLGQDDQVNIKTAHPEFLEWRWLSAPAVLDAIVPFKRAIYQQVFDGFKAYL